MSSPYAIPTPASRDPRPTAVVLGAGIAGLTAAHELVERGFDVTVYESRADERNEVGPASAGPYPAVKLGGLAASQYPVHDPGAHGSRARLRPFPGRRSDPRPPDRPVAGEHGFRFFPAYYLHIWDMLQRIPLYESRHGPDGGVTWHPTSRTVMDNIRRVVTVATTVRGKPTLILSRQAPQSLAEVLALAQQAGDLGVTSSDAQTLVHRLLHYMVTSPLRRSSELQNLSAYDFFIGRDTTAGRRFTYTPSFEALILEMPKILAAYSLPWGDARTTLTTFLQLFLQMDPRDDKADGVLNGPTTNSWFDHWYRHLVELGVRFVRVGVDHLEPPAVDRLRPPHLRPRVPVVLADGTSVTPDYTVVAVDAPTAERITQALREAGTGGTVADLDGFTTSAPPTTGPLEPEATRPPARRDPYLMDQMGRAPWDRFQTLTGIQFYFDTEFRLVRGHVYFSGTEWGLTSINQQGVWEKEPVLPRDGYASVLSVDIGDFNAPSRQLVDEHGRGKAARDCTFDELASEVWRQIVAAIVSEVDDIPESLLPWPVWYAVDRNLITGSGPGQGDGPPIRNEAPYLIPIVGDWPNRPGSDPWDPSGTSWTTRPTDDLWEEDLERRDVWQARHGGYQVHHNSLVFAGTWTRTFTRMTTMEAACESARHAVNAILDHYVWGETGGTDVREGRRALDWRMPLGSLYQGATTPIRLPSPAGDYCFVFDLENRELLDARRLRNLDSRYVRASLPHPLGTAGPVAVGAVGPPVPAPSGGQPVTTSPDDYTGQLLTHLQAWRQHLEQTLRGTAPGQPSPTAPWQALAPAPPHPAAPMPPESLVTPGATPGHLWTTAPWLAPPAPPGPPLPPVATPSDPRRPGPAAAASSPPGGRAPLEPRPGEHSPEAGTSGGAGGWQEHQVGRSSLFDPSLTTPTPAAVTDPPATSAYSWTGVRTGAGTSTAAALRSLYTKPTPDPRTAPSSSAGRPTPQAHRRGGLHDPARTELIGADPPD
jgi:putative NAD(P)-binding protein